MSQDNTPPTKRAAAFMSANATSPVVEGYAHPGGSGRYVLENGADYKLTAEDLQSLPFNWMPRWLHDR